MKTKYLKFYLINRFSYLKYLLYNNLNYNKSFFLPIILNYLNIEIPDDALPIINFSFGIFLLAIIALLCFLNVVGYLSAIILLNKYKDNIEIKYPRLKKFLLYFENTSLVYVLIDGILCIIFLLSIIFSCLRMLGIKILN